MKRIALLLCFSALAGCGDRYRYPCQDPDKAHTIACSCDAQPRTKNKALGIVGETTTTTIPHLKGFDC